jgi:hypothetical protein
MSTSQVHSWLSTSADGYCGLTTGRGDCDGGLKGSWRLSVGEVANGSEAAAACLRHCTECRRCRFISVSQRWQDCSWFYKCPTLEQDVAEFISGPSLARLARGNLNLSWTGAGARGDATGTAHLRASLLSQNFMRGTEAGRREADLRDARQRDVAALERKLAHWLTTRVPPSSGTDGGNDHADPPVLLMLGLMSSPSEEARRAYVRRTYRDQFLGRTGRHAGAADYRFVIGQQGLASSLEAALESEHAYWRDILKVDAPEGYGPPPPKVFRWFMVAARLFPTARFVGKADTDSFIVWPRVQSQLQQAIRLALAASNASTHAGPPPVYVGKFQYASYSMESRHVCGCCGGSWGHGQRLRGTKTARGGPCDWSASSFAFATGPFYALSSSAVRWLAPAGAGANASAQLLGELTELVHTSPDKFEAFAEDIMLGFLLSRFVGLAPVHMRSGAIHNIDNEDGRQRLFKAGSPCLRLLNVSQHELDTGFLSDVHAPESLSPLSAVVHHVSNERQWNRTWAITADWARRLRQPLVHHSACGPLGHL